MLISKLLQINEASNPTKKKKTIRWRNTTGFKNNVKDDPVIGQYHSKTEIWFPPIKLALKYKD